MCHFCFNLRQQGPKVIKLITLLLNIMKKEAPVANRLLQRLQLQKNNDILLTKLMKIKYSNISSIKTQSAHKTPLHRHPVQHNQLVNSDHKHIVKPVLRRQSMRSENKSNYDNLISRKSIVSPKLFESERLKKVQFLRKIGRYPCTRAQSTCQALVQDQQAKDRTIKSNTLGDFQQSERINICQNQNSLSKNKTIANPFPQQQLKDHQIVLYQKVVKLTEKWFTIKFQRYKNRYQIILLTYPDRKFKYVIKLQQKVGMAMLTQNDYDYEHIYSNFIKFTNKHICLSFELPHHDKKQHFYRFQKKNAHSQEVRQGAGQQEARQIGISHINKEYRMHVFAVGNQTKKLKKQSLHRCERYKTDISDGYSPLRKLQKFATHDVQIASNRL